MGPSSQPTVIDLVTFSLGVLVRDKMDWITQGRHGDGGSIYAAMGRPSSMMGNTFLKLKGVTHIPSYIHAL